MKSARWYEILLDLKPRHRYVLAFMVNAALILFWFFIIYLPLYKTQVSLGIQAHQYETELSAHVKEQSLCAQLQQQVNQLRCELYTDYAQKVCVDDIISSLIKQLVSSKLTLISIAKEAVRQKEWYEILIIGLKAQGTLPIIHNFFDALQVSQPLVQCSDFAIQYSGNAQYNLDAKLKFFFGQKKMQ